VILLTGDGASSYGLQNGGVNDPAGRFAGPLHRRTLLELTLSLELALSRARSIVPFEQVVVVANRAHKHYWNETLSVLPGENVIVQPCHRGSAIEVLLGVLTILERDPWARIITMPSHHYVNDETALSTSLLNALTPTAQTRNNLAVIGIKPERPDTESSYIVPGRWFEDGTRSALRIVVPSGKTQARELAARGALWNSSIVAARASVLVGVFRMCVPDLVDQMETAMAQGDRNDVRQRTLSQLHARLPSVDLSHILAQCAETECRVITSRSCGWSNLAPAQRTLRPLPFGGVPATV
jgi:mannose-1-phosphate guanylyltransferase